LCALADYRKIDGHCNVPYNYSENSEHNLHMKERDCLYGLPYPGTGKLLEWEDRLGELADYRNIGGHCNVPHNYSENSELATSVTTQRKQYNLHMKERDRL
jgi:hypothetical protein